MKQSVKNIAVLSSISVIALMVHSDDARAQLGDRWANIPTLPSQDKIKPKPKDYSLATAKFGGEIATYYDDNIFESSTDKESDFITVLKPVVKVDTDLEDHSFGLYAESEIVLHADNTKNNYTDFEFGTNGRYALNSNYSIFGDARIGKYHSPIGSFVDDPDNGLSEPVSYLNIATNTGISYQSDDWFGELAGHWNNYNYDDTLRNNNTVSIQDDRDHNKYDANLLIGKHINEAYGVYVQTTATQVKYDERIDSSLNYTKDSKGFDVLTGVSYNGDTLNGSAAIGYMVRNYDASQLPSISQPAIYLSGKWKITPSEMISVKMDNQIRETTSTGVSGYVRNRVNLGYDRDLTYLLSAGLGLEYEHNDFETNGGLAAQKRKDNIYEAQLWGEYDVYDDIALNLSYAHRDRRSNVGSAEYKSNIFSARLKFDY